jgi:hypothetical protein
MKDTTNLKSSVEIADDILKSLGASDDPVGIILPIYLQKVIDAHRTDAVNEYIKANGKDIH